VFKVKPTPETARALEARAREAILREADEAIYERRKFAVENERTIKQSELDTEVAIEEKSARSGRLRWKLRRATQKET